ncbi:hypothetical protein VNO80_28694 [Phaseolus coccineus]|uniref:Uncharacterized protein n=1 Tax=Phaseolus coccineus TaxID=3886 RepID=A0AAN9LA26_PHACN
MASSGPCNSPFLVTFANHADSDRTLRNSRNSGEGIGDRRADRTHVSAEARHAWQKKCLRGKENAKEEDVVELKRMEDGESTTSRIYQTKKTVFGLSSGLRLQMPIESARHLIIRTCTNTWRSLGPNYNSMAHMVLRLKDIILQNLIRSPYQGPKTLPSRQGLVWVLTYE